MEQCVELNECVSVHLDCGDFAAFGLFPQDERLCVFQVLHWVTVKTIKPSLFSFLLVKFHLLRLLTLLLVAVLKYLLIRRRWVVAVGRRWRIGDHHFMCWARLCWVHRVRHGEPWVATCHPVDPKTLHTSWLLGNWKEETQLSFGISSLAYRLCDLCHHSSAHTMSLKHLIQQVLQRRTTLFPHWLKLESCRIYICLIWWPSLRVTTVLLFYTWN